MPSKLRLAALAFAAVLSMAATPGRAGDAAPPADPAPPQSAPAAAAPPARYTMLPSPGGFVRLDTDTGLVSQCRRETTALDGAWRCAAIPEAELMRPDRVDSLAARLDQLAGEIGALAGRVAALQAPPPAPVAEAPKAGPSATVPSFTQEALRRVALLVARVKSAAEPRPGEPPAP